MRSRNIKPGFFLNCELAEVDFASRLLFIGLWCYADRDGRFEWKPKQIKAAIFPYDNVNIEKLLCNLLSCHVITSNDNIGYIPHFKKHQHPHPHEAKSILPELPCKINVIACHDNGIPCQEDVRIKDVMIKDIKPLSEYSDDFIKFWSLYPSKIGKGDAWKSWKKANPKIEAVLVALTWQVKSQKWIDGYIPNPATYLNQRRWEDEPAPIRQTSAIDTYSMQDSEAIKEARRKALAKHDY